MVRLGGRGEPAGLRTEMLHHVSGEEAGIKSAMLDIKG